MTSPVLDSAVGPQTASRGDLDLSPSTTDDSARGPRRRALFPFALAGSAAAAVSMLGAAPEALADGPGRGNGRGRGDDSIPGLEDVDVENPQPFTSAQLGAAYPSDRTVDYVPLLSGFLGLQNGHPEVLDENLAHTLEINQGASDDEAAAAIVDEYGDMSYTMANGLGDALGAIYQAAVDAGRLPKTTALIHKDGGRAQSESTTPAKEFFDYDRPYMVAPDDYVPRDKDGGDAYLHLGGLPQRPYQSGLLAGDSSRHLAAGTRTADPRAHRRVRPLPHRDGDALSVGRDRWPHDGPGRDRQALGR